MDVELCACCTAHAQTWFPLELQGLPVMQGTAPTVPQTHFHRDCHATLSETLPKVTAVKQWQQALHCRTGMTTVNKAQQKCDCSCHACPAVHGLLLLLDPFGLSLTPRKELQKGHSRAEGCWMTNLHPRRQSPQQRRRPCRAPYRRLQDPWPASSASAPQGRPACLF